MVFIHQQDKFVERKLQYALHYVDKGWSIFPAPPGEKKSYKSAEFSNGRRWGATNDLDEIIEDFAKWPDANIGIPTGKDNGIWCLDVDTSEHGANGFASFANLEIQYGKLPDTLQAISPPGSIHYYFKYPSDIEIRNSTSVIGAGIDVRGDGGMVLAPPSIKPGKGAYKWHKAAKIAFAPDWLIELVKHEPRPPSEESHSVEHIIPSDFQNALFSIPPDFSRQGWFEIMCALYNIGGDAAKPLFDLWSRGGQKYDATGNAKQWESIKGSRYKYGIGTIYYYANQFKKGIEL